ncbi:MAG: hypothetical protein AAF413_01575 [Patescibacteria group bacterium]
MDSIKDLLKNKDFDVPSELESLKKYVLENYGYEPYVRVTDHSLSVHMHTAADAGVLRMNYGQVMQRCQLTRKLYIKISEPRH